MDAQLDLTGSGSRRSRTLWEHPSRKRGNDARILHRTAGFPPTGQQHHGPAPHPPARRASACAVCGAGGQRLDRDHRRRLHGGSAGGGQGPARAGNPSRGPGRGDVQDPVRMDARGPGHLVCWSGHGAGLRNLLRRASRLDSCRRGAVAGLRGRRREARRRARSLHPGARGQPAAGVPDGTRPGPDGAYR